MSRAPSLTRSLPVEFSFCCLYRGLNITKNYKHLKIIWDHYFMRSNYSLPWLHWSGIIHITAPGTGPSSMLIKFVITDSTVNQISLQPCQNHWQMHEKKTLSMELLTSRFPSFQVTWCEQIHSESYSALKTLARAKNAPEKWQQRGPALPVGNRSENKS